LAIKKVIAIRKGVIFYDFQCRYITYYANLDLVKYISKFAAMVCCRCWQIKIIVVMCLVLDAAVLCKQINNMY